jgi:FixJ family two-component response regulator
MSLGAPEPTVFVVDDDPAVRKALSRLLREDGFRVDTFDSAEAFLAGRNPQAPGCLVLDVMLPGLDGLELQRRLAQTGEVLQIVFLTGHGDIPMSVRTIKAGAADFLTKPVSAAALLPAVRAAMERDASGRQGRADAVQLKQRLATLTPRERQVLAAVAAGKLNKQIAADLGIVEQTVKFHRARLMDRMQARTAAELMHIAAMLGIGRESPAHGEADLRAGPRRNSSNSRSTAGD